MDARKADLSIFSLNDKAIPIIPNAIPIREKLFARKATYILNPEEWGTREKGLHEYSLAVT